MPLSTTIGACAAVLACATAPGTIATHRLDASTDHAQVHHCRAPAHAKVLAHTDRLVMWSSVRTVRERYYEPERAAFIDACVPPHGATHLLASVSAGKAVQCGSDLNFATAGSFVAMLNGFGCSSGWQESLELVDVRHGAFTQIVTFSAATGSTPEESPSLVPLGPPFGLAVQQFRVDARGDVAWLAANEPQHGESEVEVLYLHDLSGYHRVAAATSIGRVAFHGTLLTWRAGGAAHSTPG